jgi:hypothetical protein
MGMFVSLGLHKKGRKKMEQIRMTAAASVAIESLKSAMASARIPSETHVGLIGFFCNEWIARTQAIGCEQGWDSVEECLRWINAQPDPKLELVGVIEHSLHAEENGFALDVLNAYLEDETRQF